MPDTRRVEQPMSYYATPWKLRDHLIQDHGYPDDSDLLDGWRDHIWEHENDGRHTAPNHIHP